jgi:hypothetical protein
LGVQQALSLQWKNFIKGVTMRLTTFSIEVEVDGERRTFITGAEHQGQACAALAKDLEADPQDIHIKKITPKPSLLFVPPLPNGKEEDVLEPEAIEED